MPDEKPKTIAEEAGLPENWVPKDTAPIIPGAPIASQQQGPGSYFAGPLSSSLQHDAAFYQTKYGGAGSPEFPLMPLAPSGNASNNAGITSVIRQTQIAEGPGVLFETNGIKDPDQAVQNSVAGTGITIAVDNAGNKTFSATAQSSIPQWPLPNTAVVFMARAIVAQTGLQTIGDASTNIQNGGTVSVNNASFPSASQGVAIDFSVGSGAGAAFNGWFPTNFSNNANGIFRAGRNCKYQARVGVGASTAGVIVFLGFSTADPSTLRTFPFVGANHYLGLYTPGVGISDNWHATINGSAVDTGVPIGTGSALVEIIMNDTANTTSFSINGSTPTIISGSNPSGFNWVPITSFAVNILSSVNFLIEYFYAQQDF
jgi:hypothetical protein